MFDILFLLLLTAGPQDELKKEIRNIALNNHAPDGYMWSLLKLARAVDKCFVQRGPLVGQCFNSAEYKEAKKVISALVKHAEDDRTEAALQEDDKDP